MLSLYFCAKSGLMCLGAVHKGHPHSREGRVSSADKGESGLRHCGQRGGGSILCGRPLRTAPLKRCRLYTAWLYVGKYY